MPRIYKPGQAVGKYKVTAELNRGMMAIAYSATDPGGRKVFLKQYKSPTITVGWYRAYIEYQKELRKRIEGSHCQSFCYEFLDSFEVDSCFFQTFEFLDKSDNMQALLDKARSKPSAVVPNSWLLMAKVLMGGMAQLHDAKIVHSDLKPDNVMLIHDEKVGMKFRLRIIDMDFSLLADKKAPWHGDRGYFGTVGYLSPEHLTNKTPAIQSDVFTLGLMLHEMLGGEHPYRPVGGADPTGDILKGKAPRLKFRPGVGELLENRDEVADVVQKCLSPEPAVRPTARQVLDALNNRLTKKSTPTPTTVPPAPRVPHPPPVLPKTDFVPARPDSDFSDFLPPPKSAPVPPPTKPAPPPPLPVRIALTNAAGVQLATGQALVVGQTLLKQFGAESGFASEPQFRLDREGDDWFIEPMPGAQNQTLVNGKKLTGRVKLNLNDEVAVGKEERGVIKLPLKVRFL